MIQLQFPEFLLLAIPLALACQRWGSFRFDWRWLLPVAAWILFVLTWQPVPWWTHLWLVVPVVLSVRHWLRETGVTGGIRLLLVGLLLLALAGPEWNLGGRGLDVVVVADRSRSMPPEATRHLQELIRNIETARGTGDRVGIVTFGTEAAVERGLSADALMENYTREVPPDGSDLHDALMAALRVVDPNRPARIVVLSDGESNGPPPVAAARRARERDIPVDYRIFERQRVGDAAVRSVSLPETVAPREPFQFSVEVSAERDVTGTVTVLRDGRPISKREATLFVGTNRLSFRDLIEQPGMHNYSVQLDVADDPLEENNTGLGLVRVDAGPRVLVLTDDGSEGNLVRALRGARLPVDVAIAGQHPLTQDALDPYRAVVLENVAASKLGRVKMERLAQFVEDLGGGLLMTGGMRSFGQGGYYNSPLDDVLPVSMEMREEHRKTRVAIAVALDRSGSMSVPVAGTATKMDLANLGTAECIRLLSSGDSVAVIAVDSSPHTIQPLTPVHDAEAINSKVLKIESLGGGIFVYEALVAAGEELMKADQATKHIILFSDAADSEEPGNYQSLLAQYRDAGITVSVIGLGTETDIDAQLLKDIAQRGEGNIMFTTDPQELPRLFTEDTMSVARNSFIEKDPETQAAGIPAALLPDSRLMGNLPGIEGGDARSFPPSDGYNLSYLKPDATAAVISQDEYQAPWSAFWYRGLGRVAAITVEVDGQFSGTFGTWDGYDDFVVTHLRWLLGSESPDDVFVDVQREGQDAAVTIELNPDRPDKGSGEAPKLIIVPPGQERTETITPDLTWIGPDTLQARFPMDRVGSYRTLVVDESKPRERGLTRGPAVTLPYSPEFAPRDGLPTGSETLEEIASLSGGIARTNVLEVFDDPPRTASTRSMLPWLFAAGIVLLLLEIAGRRLSLWERLPQPQWEGLPSPAGWLPRLPQLRRKSARRRATPAEPQPTVTPDHQPPSSPRPATETKPARPAVDVFAQAKHRAKKRTQ
ncbi:vWA domain-containing protein [Maioricimonas sp. JC845]|uniref:vWA domain-containing protein n=1 Tax=Maioricimonas sp. JC845 TaxID=3232138 RepID=UPI0034585F8D